MKFLEIVDGLYLGQLIYVTDLRVLFNLPVVPGDSKYKLFGEFLLMDGDWQRHRLAIGLDFW